MPLHVIRGVEIPGVQCAFYATFGAVLGTLAVWANGDSIFQRVFGRELETFALPVRILVS